MRNVILCFFVGVRALALAQSPQELVQDALEKQRSGQLQDAVTEYREFLNFDPEATAIHSNLGVALVGLGRFQEAIPEYKTALEQSPKLVGTRLNLALAYYKMGRIQEATTELIRVHTEDSFQPSGQPAAGRLLHAHGKRRRRHSRAGARREAKTPMIWQFLTLARNSSHSPEARG